MKIQSISFNSYNSVLRLNKQKNQQRIPYATPLHRDIFIQNSAGSVNFTSFRMPKKVVRFAEAAKTKAKRATKVIGAAEDNLFRPYKMRNDISKLSAAVLERAEKVVIKTEDGLDLECWHIKPKEENSPYMIYCHGLKRNLSTDTSTMEFLDEQGFGVFGLEYRGYARNPGVTSQEGHFKDSAAALKYLQEEQNVPINKIGFLGESFGAGVAVDFVHRTKGLMCLIASSGSSSAKALAKHHIKGGNGEQQIVKINLPPFIKRILAYVPTPLIPLKNKYNSAKAIKDVDCPTLFTHSTGDTEIPAFMSKIMDKRHPNSELVLLENDEHISTEALEPIGNFLSRFTDELQDSASGFRYQ